MTWSALMLNAYLALFLHFFFLFYCMWWKKTEKCQVRNLKADYWCVNSNTWITGRYSTWYSTLNKGILSSHFLITIPSQVICWSLVDFLAWTLALISSLDCSCEQYYGKQLYKVVINNYLWISITRRKVCCDSWTSKKW